MRGNTQSTVHSEQSSANPSDEMETDVEQHDDGVDSLEALWDTSPNRHSTNASQQHNDTSQAGLDEFDDEDIEELLEAPEHNLRNNL